MLLHHHFVQIAKKYGRKLAFIDCTTEKRVTYSKALIASMILVEKFRKYEEGFLGIMLPTSAGAALSILGTLMCGKTPVMINYSTGASENVRYAQRKCNFKTVITSKALLKKINCPSVDGMVFIEDIMNGISIADKLKATIKAKLPTALCIRSIHAGKEDDNLVVLFTSGSEKDPKAVQLTHRNIASNISSISRIIDLYDKDLMLANLPFFHVFGLTVNLWIPLCYGMTIILYANPIDYKIICNIVRHHKPTLMVRTPSFLWGYVRKAGLGDFRSLHLVLCGADKCPEILQKEFHERHGVTLYESYGTTEISPVVSVNTELAVFEQQRNP